MFSSDVKANNKLQLRLGDSVNIYSEKAYHRESGTYVEVVGNVIIISGKDTLYGEKATLNSKSGDVIIEGSVRYIGKDITIYGSKIYFNVLSGKLEMDNARMITSEFTIVASKIIKVDDKNYYAEQAEFTTCRDCKESWLVSGKKVYLEINRYIQIHHALINVKGTDVIYFPYVALPIKNNRESGLLFPTLDQRNPEGFIFEQPVFWAISDDKDATFTPTFMGQRGLGMNLQYRQVFAEKNWLEVNSKTGIDEIYQPNEQNTSSSDRHVFRHFTEFENHSQWSNDFSHHILVQTSQDSDIFRDYNYYTDNLLLSNDYGLDFFLDKRFETFTVGMETYYKRNILTTDPNEFDKNYIQTLPAMTVNMMPQVLYQSNRDFLYRITTGLDSRLSTFRQDNIDETTYLRNANRVEVYPYVDFNILNYGPLNLNSKFSLDYQEYDFFDEDEDNFRKHTALVSTEFSFTMDRIFGLAYEEEYGIDEIKEQDIMKFRGEAKQQKVNKKLIGSLPNIEGALATEKFTVQSSSYRHAQEFKFIHHQIVDSDENGNQRFLDQIQKEEGWFDYRDAIIENLDQIQSIETRTSIPLKNTFEFQWNNSLIKKSPKSYAYAIDEKYLKDQFNYSTIGSFRISQGLLLEGGGEDVQEKLTRLLLSSNYNAGTWSFGLTDYYFHQSSDNILSLNAQKRFDRLSLLANYNHNSFDSARLKTIQTGAQFRPHDVVGLSYLRSYDLDADESIESIYQIDYMPHNNCWMLNFNYRENIIEQRYAINYQFNFGDEEFKNYRNNFWSFARLR